MAFWSKHRRGAGLRFDGAVDGNRQARVGASVITVGRFSYGLEDADIREWGEGATLRIGAFCSIARGLTVFLGGNHRIDWATTYPFGHVFADELDGKQIVGHPQSAGDVVIGNDVWIGANVTILSGVTIGDGAVIAATATVTRSVDAYEIWGGNPARALRPRFDREIAQRLHALNWWDWPVALVRQIAPILSAPPDVEALEKLEALRPR